MTQDASGTTTAVPFDVIGTATGVSNTGSGVVLQLGALSVGIGSLQSIAQ